MGSYGLYCRSTYNTEASCYDDEFDSESVGDLDSDYIHVYKWVKHNKYKHTSRRISVQPFPRGEKNNDYDTMKERGKIMK